MAAPCAAASARSMASRRSVYRMKRASTGGAAGDKVCATLWITWPAAGRRPQLHVRFRLCFRVEKGGSYALLTFVSHLRLLQNRGITPNFATRDGAVHRKSA